MKNNTTEKKSEFFLFKFANKILNLAKNFEKIQNKYPEIISLVLYPILFIVVAIFHEPWFDEAQAWQIAKCASYKDILFYLPHFEGHPPFWHIFLSIFAKNNFPYEITIKTISFVFSYSAMILIVLKSPFYRIINILIPFTYFSFYQFGIISRPYSMTMLAFVLLAICYQNRNINPLKYLSCLIFLSLTHIYAFILAFFICAIWFFENLKNKKIFILGICFIFFSIILTTLVFPDKTAYAISMPLKMPFLKRLIYCLFILPLDALFTNVCCCFLTDNYKNSILFMHFLVSLFFFWNIYQVLKQKNTFKLFIIPFIFFAIFSTKYLSSQHIGIITFFLIFISWITLKKEKENNKKLSTLNKNILILFILATLTSQLWWSFKSSLLDIFYVYSNGKLEVNFIKENNLENYKIMGTWADYEDEKEEINANLNGTLLTLAPYFEKNIFYNFSSKNPKQNYVLHKKLSKEENEENFKLWKKEGYPDVIVDKVNLNRIFDNDNSNDYITVFSQNSSYISKGEFLGDKITIIKVKKEIAEKLNLKTVEPDILEQKVSLKKITEIITCKILEKEFFIRRKK